MTNETGFPPVADKNAQLLILGSFPGIRSLEARQYYAHPQNAFWRIMDLICKIGTDISYAERLDRLQSRGIALWDVLYSCERTGSMDGAIIESRSFPNHFPDFFEEHTGITMICFNGQKAARLFDRFVAQSISTKLSSISLQALPSTSPAYASMPFAEKALRWKRVIAGSIDLTVQR